MSNEIQEKLFSNFYKNNVRAKTDLEICEKVLDNDFKKIKEYFDIESISLEDLEKRGCGRCKKDTNLNPFFMYARPFWKREKIISLFDVYCDECFLIMKEKLKDIYWDT